MNVSLVYVSSAGRQKLFPLETKITSVGRKANCDLQIPLSEVSRKHCEFVTEDDDILLRDLDSANGTYVNKQRITETALKAGDFISIGAVTLVVQIDGKPENIELEHPGLGKSAAQSPPVEGDGTDIELGREKEDKVVATLGLNDTAVGDLEEDILGESFFAELEEDDEE